MASSAQTRAKPENPGAKKKHNGNILTATLTRLYYFVIVYLFSAQVIV